jgi:hypothetical protein
MRLQGMRGCPGSGPCGKGACAVTHSFNRRIDLATNPGSGFAAEVSVGRSLVFGVQLPAEHRRWAVNQRL